MKLVARALRPTSGSVELDWSSAPAGASPGRLLGFAFDPVGIPGSFTPRSYLEYEARCQRLDRAHVDDAVARFGLGEFQTRKVSKLSTGQRQRTALAGASMSRPQVLMLDEPTNGLDIESVAWLRDVIAGRAADGLTTIVSSHHLGELQAVAERILIIRQTLRFDGTFDDFATGALAELEDRYFAITRDEEPAAS